MMDKKLVEIRESKYQNSLSDQVKSIYVPKSKKICCKEQALVLKKRRQFELFVRVNFFTFNQSSIHTVKSRALARLG